VFGLTSSNSAGIFKSPHPSFPLSFLEHFNEKQDLLKPKGDQFGGYWSLGQIERSLCDPVFDADWDRPSLLEDNEKRTSPFKDSGYLYHPKDSVRWERFKLHLCYSLTFLCCVNCTQQHAERADRQQQGRPSAFEAHNEVLQQTQRKYAVHLGLFRACQVLNKNLPPYLKDPPKNMLD